MERASVLARELEGTNWSYNTKRERLVAKLFFDHDLESLWTATAAETPAVRDGLRSDAVFATVAWARTDLVRAWAQALDDDSRRAVLGWVARATDWNGPGTTAERDAIVRTLRARAGTLQETRDGVHDAFALLGRAARGFQR